MIERFHQYPEEVITNFYKNSGLKTKLKNNFKKVNYRNLLNALDELLNDDLQVEFDDLDCNIFSVFSLKDRIFKPSLDRIKELKCKKHTIKLLDVNNHAMPRIEPKKTFDLIDGFLRSLERKDCEKKN